MTALTSSNVIGAISAGVNSGWVKRSPEVVFDPWEIEPTLTVAGLNDLADEIKRFYG